MAFWNKITPVDEPVMTQSEFNQRVTAELQRFSKKRIGALAIEAKTIVNHLRQNNYEPSPRDLIELLVITHILWKKYKLEQLQPWSQSRSYEETRALFDENRQHVAAGKKDWSCTVFDVAFELHRLDLEHNTLQWLIEWEPEEYRIHLAKVAVLDKASFATLTKMLVMLAEREQRLLNDQGEIAAAPDGQTTLWQSISETRSIRNEVAKAWCANKLCPVDYAEAVLDAAPIRQLDFLKNHKGELMTIIADHAEAMKKRLAEDNQQPTETNTFSLYN